jgi:hypothetical protein
MSSFQLTHSTHPVADCATCASCRDSAVGTARVTGSTSARYTHQATGSDMTEHSATVSRLSIFWTTPASPVDDRPGTTDTALIMRYPDGQVIPLGIQTGTCAIDALPGYLDLDGYTVLGVRRGSCNVLELPIP